MDADTFVQLAAGVVGNAERTTLYASGADVALTISKQLNAYRRAGDTRPAVLVIPGIDTVDVTDVDSNFVGHYYYGDNRSVISDVFLLITKGLGPSDRPTLKGVGLPPRSWRFAR
jgi:esterase/lipase superfamily enzyme